jgi:adenylate cyclase
MTRNAEDLSDTLIERVAVWLKQSALRGDDLETLISGVCERLAAAGMPLLRVHLGFSMLHPLYHAMGFTWKRGAGLTVQGFRPTEEGKTRDIFLRSPHFHLLNNDLDHMRRRLYPDDPPEFPVFTDLLAIGVTDYLAFVQSFNQSAGQGMMGSWATDRQGGFTDNMIKALLRLQESLAVAAKMAVLAKLADNMMTTYLGPSSGKRVLSGQVGRGDVEQIRSVLVMGDMRDSTALAETIGKQDYVDTLNQFFDAIAAPFNTNGGEILAFIGDGFLAAYPCDRHREPSQAATRVALSAVAEAQLRMADLNASRLSTGASELRFGIGLHVGNVMLGNVGLKNRLTFSAFGSAVNEVQRLESLTKKYGVPVIASEDFIEYCDGAWEFQGKEVLKGIRDQVGVYLPTPGLLESNRTAMLAAEPVTEISDAEEVMKLFRDMKHQPRPMPAL